MTGPTPDRAAQLRVLETDRLVLDKLGVDNAEFILGLVNEPSFLENIGDRGVRNLDDARQYILDGPVASYRENGFGLLLTRLKVDGSPIGICGLVKRETLQDADLGFAFKPAYWGQGYAFESSAAVMEHARHVLGLERVVGITDPANRGSIRVLQKVGMRFVRMLQLEEDDEAVKLFSVDF